MQIGERIEHINGQTVIVRVFEPMPAQGLMSLTALHEPKSHGKCPDLDWYDRHMR